MMRKKAHQFVKKSEIDNKKAISSTQKKRFWTKTS